MTDTEKLRAIMKRAVENGWDKHGYDEVVVSTSKVPNIFFNDLCDEHGIEYSSPSYSAADILFDKDFALALWGDEPFVYQHMTKSLDNMIGAEIVDGNVSEWQYHLQQLVLADDRIDYVYRSIIEPNE